MTYSLDQMQDLLPTSITAVEKVLGMPATLMLVEKLGGTSLHIPRGKNQRGRDRLALVAKQIGSENAAKLAEFCGGEPLYIPRCDHALRRMRDLTICERFEAGVRTGRSANAIVIELALEYSITDRRIWYILKKTAAEPSGMGDLFH